MTETKTKTDCRNLCNAGATLDDRIARSAGPTPALTWWPTRQPSHIQLMYKYSDESTLVYQALGAQDRRLRHERGDDVRVGVARWATVLEVALQID
jgi:hypothetical protein